MKKIGIVSIVFLLFFVPLLTSANTITKYSVTGLTGDFSVTAAPEDRSFDAKINTAKINNSGILDVTLTLTGVKEESFLSGPGYFIFTKEDYANNTNIVTPISLGFIPLQKDQTENVNFTKTLTPDEYVLVVYDSRTDTFYQSKEFSVTVERLPIPTNPPLEDPLGNTVNSNNTNTNPPQNNQDGSSSEFPQFLSDEEKLGNPFKQLGSFEKIATALLTGIIIPVGIPVLAGFIMYSGFLFVQARGNPTVLTKAKEVAKWTAIGGLIMLGSLTIVKFLQSTFDNITNGL